MSQQGGLVDVISRKFFYRDGMRAMIKLLAVSLAANLILVVALGFAFNAYTSLEPRYFSVDASGRITPIVPVSNPGLPDRKILAWSKEVVGAVYTYDFNNYRKQLGAAKGFFTDPGWDAFLQALGRAKYLDMVKERRMVASATDAGAPIIFDRGLVRGAYAWKVKVPINVTYQSSSEILTRQMLVTLTIVRVSAVEYQDGIAISEFIAVEGNFQN